MVPSQAMNKRKPEDTNPLLAAFAKKVKKDVRSKQYNTLIYIADPRYDDHRARPFLVANANVCSTFMYRRVVAG